MSAELVKLIRERAARSATKPPKGVPRSVYEGDDAQYRIDLITAVATLLEKQERPFWRKALDVFRV